MLVNTNVVLFEFYHREEKGNPLQTKFYTSFRPNIRKLIAVMLAVFPL